MFSSIQQQSKKEKGEGVSATTAGHSWADSGITSNVEVCVPAEQQPGSGGEGRGRWR